MEKSDLNLQAAGLAKPGSLDEAVTVMDEYVETYADQIRCDFVWQKLKLRKLAGQ